MTLPPEGARLERLRELFDQARERPVAEREAFLRQAGGGDLAEQVLRMLSVADLPTEELTAGATQALHAAARPERIGPYRVIDEIKGGGMGIVYRAQFMDGNVPVRVALKVIRLGTIWRFGEKARRRFEFEAQVLAAMDHEAIAKVHSAGITDVGDPYLAMELVDGVEIDAFCDRHRLSIPARIRLFQRVCAGVDHAHRKQVIHRDLKPGNVLVADRDGEPLPKIIDFGIARAVDRDAHGNRMLTEEGSIAGTREYMSPEQAAGRTEAVDTRTDVYALGVMLYELLTGELPFDSERLQRLGATELARVLSEEAPPRPSARLLQHDAVARERADARATTSEVLERELRRDLDWIVLTAMAKEPERRYASAAALSEDLERYLRGLPVSVGPPGVGYRLRKLVRRYRIQFAAGVALLFVLIAGIIGTSWGLLRAKEKNREFDQLAGAVLYDRAIAAEKDLYPAWPDKIKAMERWLQDCGTLLAMRAEINRTVADLRASGMRTAATMEWPLDRGERFLHDTLHELLDKLADLEKNAMPKVDQRLRWARQIKELSNVQYSARWDHARAAIAASERYRAHPIDLRRQMGLVPIGENPKTGLWEFYELRSAWDGTDPPAITIPQHDAEGRILVGDDTGIVFVLLPAATFWMGAQDDPHRDNYDPAPPGDARAFEVTLREPFFIARHELTRGQWKRLASDWEEIDPSYWHGESLMTEPVTGVSFVMGDRLLRRHGLTLPTEAQWEYACRAGTTTPWFTGDSLAVGYANVLDTAAFARYPDWSEPEPLSRVRLGALTWSCGTRSDAYAGLAPVGRFKANAFGLHDTHGNVWEWCHDIYAVGYDQRTSAENPSASPADRVVRGGSYADQPGSARSSKRYRRPPEERDLKNGLRAVRAVL